EALLSLPSLAVFKQEAPSPTGAVLSPPRGAWPHRRPDDRQRPHTSLAVFKQEAPSPTGAVLSPPRGAWPHRRPDDRQFQYVLAAATSIATKQNEETLTVIKICFHERRLQYMEREQISHWHAERPGERIVEVNCISTEFTAKKHGGEKGVPFRIQVETCLASDELSRLHAAACQIKGADRKHKQDREKVMRRSRSDIDKYQPGCEATVLTTLSNDAMMPPPSLVTTSPPYSPEIW
ncbi:Transcription factor CP2-like protein 1, partial [Operophtera brumata]